MWWDQYIDDVRATFKGELWTQDAGAKSKYGLNYVKSLPGNGFIKDRFEIKQGCNSGYQAINLAYHFGAKRVLLLGYDMKNNGRWHKDHPGPCGNHNQYAQWAQNFDRMNPPMEVINCTPDSGIKAFPMVDLDEEIKNIY